MNYCKSWNKFGCIKLHRNPFNSLKIYRVDPNSNVSIDRYINLTKIIKIWINSFFFFYLYTLTDTRI